MKIVKAMKEVARLKGEIQQIKKRIAHSLNTLMENPQFPEYFKDLVFFIRDKNNKNENFKNSNCSYQC